ncbi:MAG: DUF3168 domain-containing protein [Rhizobiaceae bacterium]|nr:DUF3168 domain-containing protein [Rhizobiaceae bacterium]
MTAATSELQGAIFAALTGDIGLTGLLGGSKVFDHVPANSGFPYLTFGRTSIYDWSTGTEDGTEQLLTLHVWSKLRGKGETMTIMERARLLLHDMPLALGEHSLVNLRHEFSEVRFDEDLDVYHGLLRFRAVTEPTG